MFDIITPTPKQKSPVIAIGTKSELAKETGKAYAPAVPDGIDNLHPPAYHQVGCKGQLAGTYDTGYYQKYQASKDNCTHNPPEHITNVHVGCQTLRIDTTVSVLAIQARYHHLYINAGYSVITQYSDFFWQIRSILSDDYFFLKLSIRALPISPA